MKNHLHKPITWAIALLICMLFATPSLAAPSVVLDGQQLSFDVPPTIENGRTLIPLRSIFEALGAEVQWDNATRTVTAVKDGTSIKLTIDHATAYKNGSPVKLDVPSKIVNSRTIVPLSFVSEALGANVGWDGTTRTVSIVSPTSCRSIPISNELKSTFTVGPRCKE